MRSLTRTAIIVPLPTSTLSCCASQPSIAGEWSASAGRPTEVITDSGARTRMYCAGGQVLDIGAPETCSLGSQQTGASSLLVVEQSPNEATYRAVFSGNTLVLETSARSRIVTLTRQ